MSTHDLRAHPCYPATTFPQLASAMTPRWNRYRPAVIFAMLAAGASANPARADDIVLKDAASMAGAVVWLSSGAPGLGLAGGGGGGGPRGGVGQSRRGRQGRGRGARRPA